MERFCTRRRCFLLHPALNADASIMSPETAIGRIRRWRRSRYQDVVADVSVKSVVVEPSAAHAPIIVTVTDSGGLTAHSSFELNVQSSP